MYTQTAGDVHAVAYKQCVVDMMGGKAGCHYNSEDVSPTLTRGRGAAGDIHAVAYEEPMGIDQYNGDVTGKASSTLGVNCGMSTGRNGVIEKAEVTPQISTQATVRRLLPVECERLMGFPDNHTRIAWKGKSEEDCPDAPRYKACGNSMAVNCMMWLGERIQMIEEKIPPCGGISENTGETE
jgi:DNA (cytosine-5)-methyltransferase 1